MVSSRRNINYIAIIMTIKKYKKAMSLVLSFCAITSLMGSPQEQSAEEGVRKVLVSCEKRHYQQGGHLKISFNGGAGNKNDWIGVYPKGVIPQHGVNYASLWCYVSGSQKNGEGKTSGTVDFNNMDLPDGEYAVYFFKNDGHEIMSSPVFLTVGKVQERSRSVLIGLGGISVVLSGK